MNVRKRKAISPLIATLLLIAIAVAASVLTYSWVMSMVGSQSGQAQTQLRIDTVTWSSSDDANFDILVRNTGSTSAIVESISIRLNTAGSTSYVLSYPVASSSIDQSKTLPFLFEGSKALPATPPFTWEFSTSYVIRVTSTTGFYYEMVATTPKATP
jgi:flagellin-like protein